MRLRLTFGWLVLLTLVTAIGYAQQPAPTAPTPAATRLSLAEALDMARRNNPLYRQSVNDRWQATRELTSATARLFLPTADVSASAYKAGSGTQTLGGASFPSPGGTRQSWGLGMNYQLSGATFANRGLWSAQRRAVDEELSSATILLETAVRGQYLIVLQTRAQEELARQSLERANQGLALAQARNAVGQGTLIDVRREEVNVGNAEVAVMRAQQNVENQVLVLYQQLGVPAPAGASVELTDSFPVVEPQWNLDELIRQGLAENPALRALRSRETAASWGVRAARAQYLPSLNVSAGYGRFRQCCQPVRHIDTLGAVVDTSFTSEPINGISPWNIYAQVSLPIFDGFQRSVQTAQARAQQDDLALSIRARELQVRAEVTAAYHTLQQLYRTIAIQASNKIASEEALELATQRYRVGSGTYIELLDARVAAERAAADYVTAVYDYHRAIATLENAVGRPLR